MKKFSEMTYEEKEKLIKSFRKEAKEIGAKITIRTEKMLGVLWSVIASDGLVITNYNVWPPEMIEKYKPFLDLQKKIYTATDGDRYLERFRGF